MTKSLMQVPSKRGMTGGIGLAFFLATLIWVTTLYAGPPLLWQQKVERELLEKSREAEVEFLIMLAEQADLSAAALMTTKSDKGHYVHATLTSLAERTQPPVVAVLEEEGATYRTFWIANMIWVRGDALVLERTARLDNVEHIYGNWPFTVEKVEPSEDDVFNKSPRSIEWNIELVNGPDVWNLGFTGQGAVIGGLDTGYHWEHPALKNQYRGWDGATADHDYNWHDAIHSGGGDCGPDSPEPCDDGFHGTHTMGIMVGDDGGANQIGLAPGAQWIGCRCMDVGFGTPATYTECLQWMVAPTDLSGQNPDPDLAPDVINNSWVCPEFEGCVDPNVLRPVVENVRAAGVFVVASAGNDGSECGSVAKPLAIYDAVFSVGATDSEDLITGFSSRGAVSVDGSYRLKPDIVAPGLSVRSSFPPDGYVQASGTSMAGPHVAGLVALLVSIVPSLSGQIDELEDFIKISAVPLLDPAQDCDGVSGLEVPNNTYGYGRFDALAAYQLVLDTVADTPGADLLPPALSLLPNSPNPFNPLTVIAYELPRHSSVSLTVYDSRGRRVRNLLDAQPQVAGHHQITWNGLDDHGRSMPSGVYITRLAAGGEERNGRMVLVR